MSEKDKLMDNYGAIYLASLYVLMNENDFTQEEIDDARKYAETASIEIKNLSYRPSSFSSMITPSADSSHRFDVKFISTDGRSVHFIGRVAILNTIQRLFPSFNY